MSTTSSLLRRPVRPSKPTPNGTRHRESERGQILVVFAGGAVALLAVAAVAFDVGMMLLERRDQQNAADAASPALLRPFSCEA